MAQAGQDLHGEAVNIVAALSAKGVRLWSENGELRYRAPKGVITPEELLKLQAQREQIVALFDIASRGRADSAPRPRRRTDPVPLTYAQTAMWDSGRRMERAPIRQIASATRLCGRLHIEVLRSSLMDVLRRHEALRARIVVVDGSPMQDIADSVQCDLRLLDLTSLAPPQREQEVKAAIRRLILEPFRLDVGPLHAVQLTRLQEDEHVLMVALEHVISDAYSLNILLRDLFAIYARSLDRHAPAPPPVPIHHADYAVWQRRVERAWVAEHQEHWSRVLEYPAVRFPGPRDVATSCRPGWEITSAQVRRRRKFALQSWCQARATTLAMSALTVYAATVLRWCGAREGVVRCITDGRTHPEIQNTIGNFAAPMYLRVSLGNGGSFLDLLTDLTREYCEAYRHADLHYLQSALPRSEPMRTPIFNWIPQEPRLERTLLPGSLDSLTCSNVEFENPLYESFAMDSDPIMMLHDRADDLVIELLWPRSRFSAEAMERFVDTFLLAIDAMLERPEQAITGIVLPAEDVGSAAARPIASPRGEMSGRCRG